MSVASPKDKYLESAQKFIVKGQIDRAIKEYEQVVSLDPDDVKQRQRLAELLVRANRRDEAIRQYQAIGSYYDKNAFFLKAIAVHKQIQKLDPQNIDNSLTLATLSEKHGLTGNALAEYGVVLTSYINAARYDGALKVLDRMLAIDPENPATLLKYAETLLHAGETERAFDHFSRLATQIRDRGDQAAFAEICSRIRSLFPERHDFPHEVARVEEEQEGDLRVVVQRLQQTIKVNPSNLKAWQMLADICRIHGETDKLMACLYQMCKIFPSDLAAREELLKLHSGTGANVRLLELLREFTDTFVHLQQGGRLEWYYLHLLEEEPHNQAVIEGLAEYYEVTGETEKRTALFGQERSQAPPLALAAELLPPPGEAKPESAGVADGWEEEISLELPDDATARALPPEGEGVTGQLLVPAEAGSFDESGAIIADYSGMGELFREEAGELEELEPVELDEVEEVEEPAARQIVPEEGGLDLESPARVPIYLEVDPDNDWVTERGAAVEAAPPAPAEGGETAAEERGEAPGPEVELVPEGDAAEEAVVDVYPEEPGEEGFFDLESELFPEGLGDFPRAEGPGEPAGRYSLDGFFSSIKEGIDRQIEAGDTESHFNLGIAYREMGLYDDAIDEFGKAAHDPARKVACLTLQGICHRDRGDAQRSREGFQSALALEGLSQEEWLSLTYELALLDEAEGRGAEALALYREVRAVNPGFRDVEEKVSHLEEDEDEVLGVLGALDQKRE